MGEVGFIRRCGFCVSAVLAGAVLAEAVLAETGGRPAFRRFDESSGLARKAANCVVQDEQGFLWVGTTDGLARYDGYRFEVFRPRRAPGSLSHPTVNDITAGGGALWVATLGGGVNRFDPADGTFTAYLSDARVSTVAWRDGAVWAGTPAGLNRIEASTGRVTVYRHDPDDPGSLADDRVQVLRTDGNGRLWVGTPGGLDLFHEDDGGAGFVRFLDLDVRDVAFDASGNLWAATTEGLVRFRSDVSGDRPTVYRHDPEDASSLGQDFLQAVAVDRDGRVWVGTDGRGVDRLLPDGTFVHYRHNRADPESLYHGRVLDLFFDRSGVLWVGTSEGLQQANPLSLVFTREVTDPEDPSSLPRDYLLGLYEDASGVLWLGSKQGLLWREPGADRYREARADDSFPAALQDGEVTTFYEDSAGELWVGTATDGLFRRRGGASGGKWIRYRHDPEDPGSLGSDDVPFLFEDSAGRFWIGTWGGGLHLMDREAGTFTRYVHENGGPGGEAFVLHETPPGTLWMGTWTSGLLSFRTGTPPDGDVRLKQMPGFARYRFDPEEASSLGSDRVHAIHGELETDGDHLFGTLWIGTWGGGLNRFDAREGTFRSITTADGLPSDSLYSIVEDEQGQLWVATTRGIARIDPFSEELVTFDTSDGVQESLFYYHCALHLGDGRIAFCGSGGFTSFDPSAVRRNTLAPPVVLTGLEVLGREVDPRRMRAADGALELGWRDSVFTVRVAALDFTAPRKNRYAYRLAAVADDWVDLGTRPQVAFSHLPAGDHLLEVRGSNSHGVGAEDGLRLRLRIAAPWWETWWFRGTLAGFFALLLAGAHLLRLRIAEERARALEGEILRRKQAELAREELISELEKKNDELQRFSATVAHDFKSPLFTIRGYVNYVREGLEKGDREAAELDLARIEVAADTMGRQLDAILALSRLGETVRKEDGVDFGEVVDDAVELVVGRLAQKGIEIHLAPDLPVLRADPSRMLQVFQNLVDNAAKFMGDQTRPRIEVTCHREAGENVLAVRDNGMGIAPKNRERVFDLFHRLDKKAEGTGIGLPMVKRVVELHGGRIWIEDGLDGQGCSFCFTVEKRPRVLRGPRPRPK